MFDFAVYYPENHGALLGAKRASTDMIPCAVAAGYSPDICSYLTSDIGAYLKGFTPLAAAYGFKAIPRPDVIVFNNNQCREVQDWFMFFARHWRVPIIGVNSPRVIGGVKSCQIQDVVSQLMDLIPTLEAVSGRKFDMDKLKEVVRLSKACTERWRKTLEFSCLSPAPMTFFDHCIHMGPAVLLRGAKDAVEYYDDLIDALKELSREKIAAVPGERFRIYWDGMPIWGKLSKLSKLFSEERTAIVASTYCNSWIFDSLDPDNPFESMARASLECFNVRDETFKEGYIRSWVERCDVHGIIFHDAKTCPYNTNSRFAMPRRLERELGVPTLVIHGDLNDLRLFSEEQTVTNIQAFVEQLHESRG